jgi:hypothetical protein
MILIFYPSGIPDPGVKKTPDPRSGSTILLIWYPDVIRGVSNHTESSFVRMSFPFCLNPKLQTKLVSMILSIWYVIGCFRINSVIFLTPS